MSEICLAYWWRSQYHGKADLEKLHRDCGADAEGALPCWCEDPSKTPQQPHKGQVGVAAYL